MMADFGGWWPIARDLLIFALWLHTWLNSRQAVTEKSIQSMKDEFNKELSQHSDRLARQERDLVHTPTHEDFKRVHERLDKVNNELSVLRGEFTEVKRTLTLIHEVMMDKG